MSPGPRLLILGPLGPPHVSDQVSGLAERGFEICVGGNETPGLDAGAIRDEGVGVAIMPDFNRGSVAGMARTVSWVRRLRTRFRPDVVQAHWIPGFGFAAAAAGARPLALTAWGSDVYRAGRVQRLANRFALRRAELVLADSTDLLDRCVESGASPQRCEPIQWGVDLSLFTPAADEEREQVKRRLGLGPGPVLLSPRSLMPIYNIPTIIDAFERIGAAVPGSQLVVKHMGYEGIELPPLPHRDRVHLVGSVPYERMADYYRVADVCISVAGSDSSPRSVWEAMGAGAPCVLSDLPWVEELVGPAGAALTVPVGDAAATATAVERLLADRELAAELAGRGRELVSRHLDRERRIDRLAALLQGLAAG